LWSSVNIRSPFCLRAFASLADVAKRGRRGDLSSKALATEEVCFACDFYSRAFAVYFLRFLRLFAAIPGFSSLCVFVSLCEIFIRVHSRLLFA
jgi:hypothetical protein